MTAISYGKDKNFFQSVSVTDTSFPSTPQVTINVEYINHLSLINLGTSAVNQTIEYSFNGNVVHGNLIPGTACAGLVFDDRRVSKIWFRTSASASTVRVEAW